MGFYDNPLVIRGNTWSELTSGENQLYSTSDPSNATPGTFVEFFTDPNTGNVYTNKQYDFEKGQVTYDPYLNLDDLKGDPALELKANYLQGPQQMRDETLKELKGLINLKSANPQEYQKASTAVIGDMAFNLWQANSPYANNLFAELEKYKDTSPEAYYAADIALKARQMGHNAANGAPDRNAEFTQSIQNNYGNAIKAGLTPDFINSTINQNYQTTAADRAKTNAVNAASGGAGFNFKTDMLPGLKLVGGALLGAYGAEYLGAGAGGFDSTAVAAGGSGGGGAFVPAAGSGASFGIAPGAAYTTAGLGNNLLSTADILSSTGFTPTAGSSFTIDPTAAYTTAATNAPVYDYSQPYSSGQAGPTYQELGVTGVEGGMAGPTYGELGYTGLNQSEAIAAADAASKGLTGQEVARYANDAKKAYDTINTLSKLLKSGTSGGTGSANNAVSNATQDQMANYLRSMQTPIQTNDFIGQYKMNQNPFTFNVPGQTTASQGMYDVSGSNLANALRKA